MDVVDHLDQAASEIVAFTGVPKAHWTRCYVSRASLNQARTRALESPDPNPKEVAALEVTGQDHDHGVDAASLIPHVAGRDPITALAENALYQASELWSLVADLELDEL